MKFCPKCNTTREKAFFHKNRSKKDGLSSWCVYCQHEQKIKYYKNPEAIFKRKIYDKFNRKGGTYNSIEYQRNYRNTEIGKLVSKKGVSLYKKRHPEKHSAHQKIYRAIKSGKIQKEPCWVCGDINSHGHHSNYFLPYSVIWVCKKHHSMIHKKLDLLLFPKYKLTELDGISLLTIKDVLEERRVM